MIHEAYQFEDIADDIQDLYYGDKKIKELYHRLYLEHKEKGLVYRELALSKTFGYVKYLVTWTPKLGVSILDLDNNEEYRRA